MGSFGLTTGLVENTVKRLKCVPVAENVVKKAK
jgi:hypothetical protein